MEYKVIGNIDHDGQRLVDGDTIDLTEKQAAPLIEAGVLEGGTGERAAKKAKVAAPEAEVAPAEPTTGGTPMESGEPSVDEKADSKKSKKDAKDVTPQVDDSQDPSKDL